METTMWEMVKTRTINAVRKPPSHTEPVFLCRTRLITAVMGRMNSRPNSMMPASAVGKDIPTAASHSGEVVPGMYWIPRTPVENSLP